MIRRSCIYLAFVFSLSAFYGACSRSEENSGWLQAIPADSPLVLLHHGDDLFSVLESAHRPFIEALSSIDTDELGRLAADINEPLSLMATALFPAGSHALEPVFVLSDSHQALTTIAKAFETPYAQNQYRFQRHSIHLIHLETETFFATRLGNWVLISRNSAAIEQGIRTWQGEYTSIEVPSNELPGAHFIVNTPHLEHWASRLGAPRYLPYLRGLFNGTEPAVVHTRTHSYDSESYIGSLEGTITVRNPDGSPLMSVLAHEPGALQLDRHIPGDAAFFALYHSRPGISGDPELLSPLDTLLHGNPAQIERFSATLHPETAFVAFETFGTVSSGENMFIRRLEDAALFFQLLEEFYDQGLLQKNGDIYYVNSRLMGRLLGGPVGYFSDFYLMRSAETVLMAQRSGLARRADQDRRRRAVYYYNDEYLEIRNRHPESASFFAYARQNELLDYLESLLNPINHARYLSTLADVTAMSTVLATEGLSFKLDGYTTEDRAEPVRDLWVYDLQGARITAPPTQTSLFSAGRNELFFATETGSVLGLAADGTAVFETSSGSDTPIGSPVIYDWYGNNQYAILIAAGNRIYAWNTRGIPMPNFPVTLSERITSPLLVADIARDGQPEMVVTTADRQVHVLDQRGENIRGWPVGVQVQVNHTPLFQSIQGRHALWLTAGNGLYAFRSDGERVEDFPLFTESDFGPLTIHENHLLAGGGDGYLYAIGAQPLFRTDPESDLPAAYEDVSTDGSIHMQRIPTAQAAVRTRPVVQQLTRQVRTSPSDNDAPDSAARPLQTQQVILVQNSNGSIFLFDTQGTLLTTHQIGQPATDYHTLQIADLNNNGREDLIALSRAGRIFAWQVRDGVRVEHIPTASVRYPLATVLLEGGETVLVGQTRDGIRAWSFRRQ